MKMGKFIFFVLCVILVSLALFVPVLADAPQEFTITYIISLHKDSSATWNIEYRIPLRTPADEASFEQNTNASPILSSDSIRQLMEKSAADSSFSTGRYMEIKNFSRTNAIQSSPSGTYGVIRYSYLWTNFTQIDDLITLGDVFIEGGLYLPIGASLIVQIPEGYVVKSVDPLPNLLTRNLIWYGPDSFDTGQPAVVLEPVGLPISYYIVMVVGVIVVAGAGAVYALRRRTKTGTEPESKRPEQKIAEESDPELKKVEEQILKILEENGGELYQSDIVERLNLPKSSVSSALNGLHARKLIQKVKKGRENLIRRVSND